MYLPKSLLPEGEERAVRLLKGYFAPLSGLDEGYTGGQWDTFDPSGTRSRTQNLFTADDVVSCSLLSVRLQGRTAFDILVTRREQLTPLLEGIGPDRDLVSVDDFEAAFDPVRALYRELKSLPWVGETTATKLIARKRPRLVPIMDAVVRQTVFAGLPTQWGPLHAALREDGQALHKHLVGLREAAGLSEAVSAIRIFDVLAWIEGTDNAARVMAGQPVVGPDPG